MFRRIFAIISAVSLLTAFSVSVNASEREEKTLNFAVATDLHYVSPVSSANDMTCEPGELSFDPQSGRQTAPTGYVIDSILNRCAEDSSVDFILVSGDLATYARDFDDDHETVARKFRDFEQNTGKQVYVINGNHDCGKDTATDCARFREIYNEFGYDEAVDTDESCCSYSVFLDEKYMLIALDSCNENYSVANGLDSGRLSWVHKQCRTARKTGRTPILMMHHNLLEHIPFETFIQDAYIVSWNYIVAEMFADWGIKLVFTGHTHMNNTACFSSLFGNTIYDFSNSSLGNFPAEYKVMSVNGKEVSYVTKSVEKIDADALASVCSGFSDEEIDLMKTDFKKYISDIEYGNFSDLLEKILNPGSLGIDEGSPLYIPAEKICSELASVLDVPMNDLIDDARNYGVSVPENTYKNARDMIINVILNIKEGNKKYSRGSDDYDMLVSVLNYAVKKSAVTVLDGDDFAGLIVKTFIGNDFTPKLSEKILFRVVYFLFGGIMEERDDAPNREGVVAI